MLNLEKTHPGAEDLLKNNGFSVNSSDVPSFRNAVDITIEKTINRHAKSHLILEKTHPGAEDLLKNNGFSVNSSDVPSSRNAVDITIEQTINCHAKSHSGIVGFSRNHSAYYR